MECEDCSQYYNGQCKRALKITIKEHICNRKLSDR